MTVVEFADLTCGHCLELEAVLAQLRDRYGPAQLRVVWKHLPHPQNEEAAQIHASAEAVFRAGGSRAFWEFHAALVGRTSVLVGRASLPTMLPGTATAPMRVGRASVLAGHSPRADTLALPPFSNAPHCDSVSFATLDCSDGRTATPPQSPRSST